MATIRRLANGKWQGQMRPVPGGKQITRTHARKGVVEDWIKEHTVSIVTGTYVDAKTSRQTLRAFYDTWAPRQVWEASTARSMAIAVASTPFIDEPLRAITRARVELWVKAMQAQPRGPAASPTGRGLAPSTIRTRFANVRTALRAAVADKVIPSDPTVGVRLPRVRRAEAAMVLPTSAEVRRWIDHADPRWQAFLGLCAFAGLRLGEAAALRVGDVAFTKRTIDVRRQVQRGTGGTLEVRLPKHGSERVVQAPDGLMSMLSQHVALLGLQGQPEAWLFPGERDLPAHPNTVAHQWRKAKVAAEVSDALVLHDLRHYFASGLIAAGCTVATVQTALGHSSPSITLDKYTHLWPREEDRTRRAAQGLVDEVFGATDESVTNNRAGSA